MFKSNLISLAKSSQLLKRIACMMAITGIMLTLTPSAVAQSTGNWWQPSFSEEGTGQSEVCTSGFDGMRCSGDRCDNVSFSCPDGPPLADPNSSSPIETISEERPNNIGVCPPSRIVTGAKCSGSNCDNIQLQCGRTDYTLSDHLWGGWFSEDTTLTYTRLPGFVITGVQCRGSQCDDKRVRFSKPTAPKALEFERAVGAWRVACIGGNNCENSVSKGTTVGRSNSNTLTTERSASLSATVESGFEMQGISAGYSLTAEGSIGSSSASEVVRSREDSSSSTCTINQDFEKYDVQAVWQWTMSSRIGQETVEIKTCIITCTSDMIAPKFPPGTPQAGEPGLTGDECLVPRTKTVTAPAPVTDTVLTPSTEPVTGLNAVAAMHSRGSFKQTGDKSWGEFSSTGQQGFSYREVGRDAWSIYLHDTRRDVQIHIDLFQKKIKYGPKSGPTRDLYTVTGSK